MIKIHILNENTAGKTRILAEHGLSLFLEIGEARYLFDTGQTDVFIKNAEKMNIDLLNLDGIILSHGHFDHCGGMEYLVRLYQEKGIRFPAVYVRESAFLEKTAINSDKITYRNIGIDWKREIIKSSLSVTKEKEEIGTGIWVLGNIPYTVEFEKRPEQFFIVQGEERIPDYMEDEQLLVINTDQGLCIFAGCCHAGIINCLSHVKKAFPEKEIYSVFAGMHLMGCSRKRVDQTIEELRRMRIKELVPVHCTGLEAIGRMKAAFDENCRLVESGMAFTLDCPVVVS